MYQSVKCAAAAAALAFLWAHSATAAEQTPPASQYIAPSLKLDGSIGPQWTDNVEQSKTDRINDNFLQSFLKLTLQGKTADGVGYFLYTRMFNELYDRTASDNTLATVGATLAKTFGVVDAGVNFDTKGFYDRFFSSQTRTAYDLSAYVTRTIPFDGGLSVIQPRFTVGNRWTDFAPADRTWIDAQIAVEKHLADKRWFLVHIARVQYFWYHSAATGAIPRDFVPSALLGLKYSFNDDTSVTLAAELSGRISNVSSRDFNQWAIGPTLEFSHKF